jgi:Domain of unknown function (DUF4331)
MSHHFDTPTAREDPRINLCDFYLFQGSPDTTVMAMTVNPNAGVSAPDTFRDEGLYAFRFDLNNDAREEITFKIRFGGVVHAGDDKHSHIQSFEVRRAAGEAACHGLEGELLIAGATRQVETTADGLKAYAGLAPDLFAADAVALHNFFKGIYQDKRFDAAAFENRQNIFAGQNITAIVLEVPNTMIGAGSVTAWATVSLCGHAPEVQVSRWGLPLITNIFLSDPQLKDAQREDYNRAGPIEDIPRFAPLLRDFAAKVTGLAGSVADPEEYAKQLSARLCPTTLPYRLGTAARFRDDGFNGRPLDDDVMDVMLTLASNTPLGDGVAPDKTRMRSDFPYFGEPYRRTTSKR